MKRNLTKLSYLFMSQRVPFLEIIYYVAKNSNKKIPFSQDYKAAHGAIKQLILFQESWEKKKCYHPFTSVPIVLGSLA